MNVLGIGTEIVECLRIAKLIEQHGEQFLTRAFTVREIAFCRSRAHSTQYFAAHWVAKEAILKALGVRWRKGISWHDLELRRQTRGSYRVALRGSMRDIVEQGEPCEILVTLAHCRTYATATAMLVSK